MGSTGTNKLLLRKGEKICFILENGDGKNEGKKVRALIPTHPSKMANANSGHLVLRVDIPSRPNKSCRKVTKPCCVLSEGHLCIGYDHLQKASSRDCGETDDSGGNCPYSNTHNFPRCGISAKTKGHYSQFCSHTRNSSR